MGFIWPGTDALLHLEKKGGGGAGVEATPSVLIVTLHREMYTSTTGNIVSGTYIAS